MSSETRDGRKGAIGAAVTRGIVSPTIRREMRRRNGIEPVLGHMKADGLLERNHLSGPEGDAVNAILCAIGHNCRLLLGWFRRLLARLLRRALHLAETIRRAIASIIKRRQHGEITAS